MKLNLFLRFTALSAGIILNSTAYAQPSGALATHKWPHACLGQTTQPDRYHAHGAQAKVAGAAGSRLIGDVHGNYNASHQWLPDSTVYSYSSGRGGDYENLITPHLLKYDSSLSWTTDPASLSYKFN